VLPLAVAAAALLGIIVRPFRIPEAWFAAGGAAALVLVRALPPREAGAAVARGLDVYLFLIGMMALAEFARSEGVFDWIATRAVRAAGGSRSRLLLLVYGAGVLTTAFLSNDATIVVLTPAVLAALARTDVLPEPYVFACAFVANAASFVLPISNPSNLVFFNEHMPALGAWFASFALAALASIALTYAALALVFRRAMQPALVLQEGAARPPRMLASIALGASALVLVVTSSLGGGLGIAAVVLGAIALLLAGTRDRGAPLAIARGIHWSIVVFAAGLFVIVDALDASGAAVLPRALFGWAAHQSAPLAQAAVALAAAFASNVVTNLPVGLDLGKYAASAHVPRALSAAALAGVNVGPNFTVKGSLATFLWLAILRREGVRMTPLRFAAVGCIVTPPALIVAALLTR
jgi:arsenical pump membrane protein